VSTVCSLRQMKQAQRLGDGRGYGPASHDWPATGLQGVKGYDTIDNSKCLDQAKQHLYRRGEVMGTNDRVLKRLEKLIEEDRERRVLAAEHASHTIDSDEDEINECESCIALGWADPVWNGEPYAYCGCEEPDCPDDHAPYMDIKGKG